MPTPRRDILVTSALPYANGQIHLGHLLEYIQTDIWVRFQKAEGTTVPTCVPLTHMAPPSCSKRKTKALRLKR